MPERTKTELISIVVPTYNRAEMLKETLETLIHQETGGLFSYEVVVVDDRSADETATIIEKAKNDASVPVKYIAGNGTGYHDAVNTGIAGSDGGWIAFFDDDQLAEKDWLQNLYAAAMDNGADCVGGTIKLKLPEEKLNRLGKESRAILGEHIYPDKPVRSSGWMIPSGGSMLTAKKAVEAVGGFDVAMKSGGCDSDFALRIRSAGYTVWLTPDSVAYHVIPPHRLKPEYFRWVSLRWGNQFALIDRKTHGGSGLFLRMTARAGQALLVHLPRYVLACFAGTEETITERLCFLWRAKGYLLRALNLLLPGVFRQEKFLDEIDFRKKRDRTE